MKFGYQILQCAVHPRPTQEEKKEKKKESVSSFYSSVKKIFPLIGDARYVLEKQLAPKGGREEVRPVEILMYSG